MFDDWSLVKKYFRLSEEIKRLMIYKNQVERAFYLQNMATRTEFSELGVYTRAFKVEKEVLEHIKALELIDERIKRYEIRQRYFIQYLNNLSQEDYKSLYQRFIENKPVELSPQLEYELTDEIDEIERAICLRAGIEIPDKLPQVELTQDFDDNLDTLSELFAI